MLPDFTVFISHGSADKPVALRIKQGLEDNHVRVWIDVAQIRVGESIPKKIAEALTTAGALCLLVSKHALASPWAMREFNAFLHQSISDGRAIVPCRLDDSPMPPLIADIRYADFSQSFDEGMGALLSAVRIAEEGSAPALNLVWRGDLAPACRPGGERLPERLQVSEARTAQASSRRARSRRGRGSARIERLGRGEDNEAPAAFDPVERGAPLGWRGRW